jgi:hypothetical protein
MNPSPEKMSEYLIKQYNATGDYRFEDAATLIDNQSTQITQLQAEVEALRKDAAWQPIETAPKDGSEILVAFKSVGVKCVSWTDHEWDSSSEFALWCVTDNKFEPYPLRGYNSGDEIGWMPLPKPPIAGEAT